MAPLAFLAAAFSSAIFQTASPDGRFVAVVGAVAAVLVLIRVAREAASHRGRLITLAVAAPGVAAVAWPHSPLAVGWLTFLALALGLDALVFAVRMSWRIRFGAASKLALTLIAVGPGLYLFFSFALVVSVFFVTVAPLRVAFYARELGPHEEVIDFASEDGLTLSATYTPGTPGAPGVVLVHGVGGGRTQYRPWAARLAATGYHALRVDLRGHGTSEGAISTYGQSEGADVRAAVDALRSRPEVDGERIAVVAASMGGGTVMAASSSLVEHGVLALVLLAPASDYPWLILGERPSDESPSKRPFAGPRIVSRAVGLIPLIDWRPIEHLDDRLPVLVFHGTADSTIPLELSQHLAATSPQVTLNVMPGVEHDFIQDDVARDDASWRRVEAFLRTHVGPPEP